MEMVLGRMVATKMTIAMVMAIMMVIKGLIIVLCHWKYGRPMFEMVHVMTESWQEPNTRQHTLMNELCYRAIIESVKIWKLLWAQKLSTHLFTMEYGRISDWWRCQSFMRHMRHMNRDAVRCQTDDCVQCWVPTHLTDDVANVPSDATSAGIANISAWRHGWSSCQTKTNSLHYTHTHILFFRTVGISCALAKVAITFSIRSFIDSSTKILDTYLNEG